MCRSLVEQAECKLRARRVTEALSLFVKAERDKSDADLCAAGRWQCYMLLGEFERAWQESDAISRRGKPDPNRFWDGRPLAGHRVLVRCLHGLGDTIQFVRYIPLLRDIARSVVLEAQPALKSLLADACLADEVITWSDPEPIWDRQIEIVELPRIFRTTLETIPRQLPYLSVPDFCCNQVPIEDAGKFRVGVVWKSSAFNPKRSIPVDRLARIFTNQGVSFYALQPGPEHEELSHWRELIYDLQAHLASVLHTARIVKTLDLIITVDTMMAHLAGGLGVPVWTLLSYHSDWRWMLDRVDSPWYPSMQLFRQDEPGDWDPVIERVSCELRRLVGAGRSRSQRIIPRDVFPFPALEP